MRQRILMGWLISLVLTLPLWAEESLSRSAAEDMVEEAYLDILLRHPDPAGLKTHVDLLMEGMSVEELRASFLASEEGKKAQRRLKMRTLLLWLPAAMLAGFIVVTWIRRKTAKEFVFKIILLSLSMLFMTVMAELFLRAQANWRKQHTTEAWKNVEGARRPPSNALVTLKDVIHLSPHPDIVYALFPNMSVRFLGKAMHTDESGFRITPSSVPDERALRIAGLGDSVMFGWGGADDETYLHFLVPKIAEVFNGRPVQVWNTAVPGYNTVMEVATLEEKILPRNPHLVLLHYVDNDLGLPNFIPQQDDSVTQTRSHLAAAISQWRGGRMRANTFARLVRRRGDPPPEYAHMVGKTNCVRQIQRLKQLSMEHHFEVAVICNWNAPAFLAEVCAEQDIPIIELGPRIRAYRKENNIKGFQGSVLTVSRHDPHYSALAHSIVADEIFRQLDSSGVLKELKN